MTAPRGAGLSGRTAFIQLFYFAAEFFLTKLFRSAIHTPVTFNCVRWVAHFFSDQGRDYIHLRLRSPPRATVPTRTRRDLRRRRGARVNLLRAGSGRPLILVHGLVGSSTNWRRNIAALAAHSTVYAIDQLNMGRSQRVADLDASLEATACRIVDCMDALGIAEADVAGHSHGGAVSMMLAARHPERVRSLILYAPANPFSRLSDLLIRLYNSAPGRCFAHLVPHLPSALHRFALGRMYAARSAFPMAVSKVIPRV